MHIREHLDILLTGTVSIIRKFRLKLIGSNTINGEGGAILIPGKIDSQQNEIADEYSFSDI